MEGGEESLNLLMTAFFATDKTMKVGKPAKDKHDQHEKHDS